MIKEQITEILFQIQTLQALTGVLPIWRKTVCEKIVPQFIPGFQWPTKVFSICNFR